MAPLAPGATAGVVPPSRPSSARSWLRRLWASMLFVACSISSMLPCTVTVLSSLEALALA